ncbi:MAG: type II toxin-antitoxin system VapC family toxin [Candidatus Bathyarchaeia archaeon]|nr:type II toxin-antitoxin system VapC family toxin [Candidatus Bathyarchaeota archaeon]
MRFIDSNIFLHAFLIPRRELRENEQKVKDEAKLIIKRVEEGEEEVATTIAHLSEIVNIIEAGLSLQKSLGFLGWIITSKNIKVYSISIEDYESAMLLAKDKSISANDALAYLIMKSYGIKEIYSFDKHFEQFKDVIRLPKMP